MPSQNLIYSNSISDAGGNGPWTDVGGHGSEWSIFITPYATTVSVEVSNEIPVPTTLNPNNLSQTRAAYPPYGPPQTINNYANENHAIAATVTVTHAPNASPSPPAPVILFDDRGVTFASGPQAGVALIFNPGGAAAPGQYTVNPVTGVYSFNAVDVANGFAVLLTYTTTAASAGFPLPAGSATGPYLWTNSTTNALVIAKSDLNVKWVRIRNSAGATGNIFAYLHVGK